MKYILILIFIFFWSLSANAEEDTTKVLSKYILKKLNYENIKYQEFKHIEQNELNSLYFSKELLYFKNNNYICGYGFFSPIEGSEIGITLCLPFKSKKRK